MKSWEINRSIRKTWSRDPVERVHVQRNEKGRSRQDLRKELEEAVAGFDPDDEIGLTPRLVGGKKQTAMREIKVRKGTSVIPKGCYCYDENGNCPYWDKIRGKPEQEDGFCWFMEQGDWGEGSGGLLWDQCKSCGINDLEEPL